MSAPLPDPTVLPTDVENMRPAAGPAPALQRVLAHARFEAAVLLRNGEQLLVAVVLPLLVAIGVHQLPLGKPAELSTVQNALAASLGTAIVATAFTSQAIHTGFDRRYGVLQWIATTPLGRSGYLAGKILAVAFVQLVPVTVLIATGVAAGWRPSLVAIAATMMTWLLGTMAFGALGMLLAGTLRTEAVLALANLIFVICVAGGLAMSVSAFPAWARPVLTILPPGALGESLRAAVSNAPMPGIALAAMAIWAVVFMAAAFRGFRWTSQ